MTDPVNYAYFNVEESTRFVALISKVKNLEDLTDSFITGLELEQQYGLLPSAWYGDSPRHVTNQALVRSELEKLAGKLAVSGRKTIVIDDPDLLEVVKHHRDLIPDGLMLRKDRLMSWRASSPRPVQKAPRRSNITTLIYAAEAAVRQKFTLYDMHTRKRGHCLGYLLMLKKLVTLREVLATNWLRDPDKRKWYRMIWTKPKEYLS